MKKVRINKNQILSLTLFCTMLLTTSGCIIESNKDEGAITIPLEFVFSMDDAIINGDVASVQFQAGSVTPNVVDNGAVLAFFREQGTWTAMPYTFAVENPEIPAVDYTISLGYGYDDGLIEVFYEASTPEAPLFEQPDRRIKAIIIEDLGYLSGANVNLNDYESVKSFFDLED